MYLHIETMKQCSEREIRSLYNNVSFPTPFVPPVGYEVIFQSPKPTYDPIYKGCREVTPVNINGQWFHAYEVYDLPADQIAENEARAAEEHKKACVQAVQKMLDEEARSQNFDGILSAVSYAGSDQPRFTAKGNAARNWRDNVWEECYIILADVEAGNRPAPTVEELLAELPTINWPR